MVGLVGLSTCHRRNIKSLVCVLGGQGVIKVGRNSPALSCGNEMFPSVNVSICIAQLPAFSYLYGNRDEHVLGWRWRAAVCSFRHFLLGGEPGGAGWGGESGGTHSVGSGWEQDPQPSGIGTGTPGWSLCLCSVQHQTGGGLVEPWVEAEVCSGPCCGFSLAILLHETWCSITLLGASPACGVSPLR